MSAFTADVVESRWMLDEHALFIYKLYTANELSAKIVETLSVSE